MPLIIFYNMLLILGTIVLSPLIFPLVVTSPKRRKTVLQRLGMARPPRGISAVARGNGSTRPIWVHALSVGEVLSAVSLVKAMGREFYGRDIVFSASTLTGFEIAGRRLGDQVCAVIYYPYDFLFSVKRIAGAVNPALVVIVESDIWPNFLFEMRRRRVPVILANARLSNRSFRGYKRLRVFFAGMFSSLSHICTQSEVDAVRFRHLGMPSHRITVTGNMKFDQDRAAVPESKVAQLKTGLKRFSDQPVIVAGSTHEGEEALLMEAFSSLKGEFPDLLLVIAPRNPDRAGSVCRICRAAGFSATPLKGMDGPEGTRKVDVVVVDTIGLLTALYGLSDIAFVGGSLVREGGHNPLEPACFAKPVLFGPDMSDFSDVAGMLADGGGAFQVGDVRTLSARAADLLRDPDKRRRMGLKALAVFSANSGAVGKTIKAIEACLQNGN